MSTGTRGTPERTGPSVGSSCSAHFAASGELYVPRRVLDRLSKIIPGATPEHSEPLQLLRYEDGQRYGEHHDFIEGQELLACGPRVFTLLLYLSDVEEGGETRFAETRAEEESRVIVDVEPKKGRAVLWPSVTSDDPNVKDERTGHEALPVTRGTKYAANVWVHLFDFVTPNALGCTG